jgi:hypothetical protein
MPSLLTPTELDFLQGSKEFTKDQQYYIKSRLLKKVRIFIDTELPLLQEKGYLAAGCKVLELLAAGCKEEVPRSSLVMMPPAIAVANERVKSKVGRKGVEPSTPAMSRRYPNQARPPALYTECKNLLPKYML